MKVKVKALVNLFCQEHNLFLESGKTYEINVPKSWLDAQIKKKFLEIVKEE